MPCEHWIAFGVVLMPEALETVLEKCGASPSPAGLGWRSLSLPKLHVYGGMLPRVTYSVCVSCLHLLSSLADDHPK